GRAHAKAGRAVGLGAAGNVQDFIGGHEMFGADTRLVAGALGTVGAILAAAAGFDAQEGAELDFVILPMLEVDVAGLLDKVKKRLGIELLKLVERVGSHVICVCNYLTINALRKHNLGPSSKSYKNGARIASTGSFCYGSGLSYGQGYPDDLRHVAKPRRHAALCGGHGYRRAKAETGLGGQGARRHVERRQPTAYALCT